MSEPQVSVWSEFQSLFQLSVGLNTALATFYEFLGNGPQKTALEARQWLSRARHLEIEWSSKKLNSLSFQEYHDILEEIREIRTKFIIIEGGLVNIIHKNENLILHFVRWLCLPCAITGLFCLIYSSFFPQEPISYMMEFFAIMQMFPFVIGILFVVFYSIETYKKANELNDLGRTMEGFEGRFYETNYNVSIHD